MKNALPFLLSALLCCAGFTCDPGPQTGLATKAYISDLPTQRQLLQTFRQRRHFLLIYGTHDPATTEAYRQLALKIRAGSENIRIDLRSDREVTPEELQSNILMIIGSPHSNSMVRELEGKLPFTIQGKGLFFEDRVITDPAAVLSLSLYPNPYQTSLPLMITTGRSDEAILQLLGNKTDDGWGPFGRSAWGFEVFQQGRRVLLGSFDTPAWTIDQESVFDFSKSPHPLHQTDHYQFVGISDPVTDSLLAGFAGQSEQAAQKILAFTGFEGDLPKFYHHLYSSAEEKGLMLGNTRQAHVDFQRNEVHTVLNDTYRNNCSGKENELLLRHILGQPSIQALEEGLGIYFTPNWQIRGYAYWAGKLSRSGILLPLAELLDNEWFAESSRLLRGCLSASFVAFLTEHWGREVFLERYASWQPSAAEVLELEALWRSDLRKKEQEESLFSALPKSLPYLKGFNFAHEGYAIYNGYLSRQATQALRRLTALRSNAVAIIPYSYIRDPNAPAPIPVAERPGSENDESVVHSAEMAQQLGMTAVLKPQIWLGGGKWPGDVEMTSEADWKRFFDYYGRWIIHYAMLAEIQGIDFFCIGTEFARTTLQREADWRRLIRSIRSVYSGPITYAANWGEEFEKIAFWDALDYIGLDCYYPLSDNPNATREELKAGFQQVIRRIESVHQRFGKPVLFTEIGFSSVEAPWVSPHKDGYEKPFNGEHQQRCYEVVLESIAGQPWCQGILWWEFPSDLSHTGRDGKGFSPKDKPAEQVVATWFGRMGS